MYGKIIDNELHQAPKKLIVNDTQVWNPSPEQYASQGWKEVIFTQQPDNSPEGYQYISGWEEQTDAIVQTWTLEKLPDDIDDSEALSILLGGE